MIAVLTVVGGLAVLIIMIMALSVACYYNLRSRKQVNMNQSACTTVHAQLYYKLSYIIE